MATKLKNFSTNTVTKSVVFLLVILLIIAAVVQGGYLLTLNINPESLFVENYTDSEQFYHQVNGAFSQINELIEDPVAYKEYEYVDEDFYYYLSRGDEQYSNVENTDREFFAQNKKAFFAYENGQWSFGEETDSVNLPYYHFNAQEGDIIYIAFPDEVIEEKQAQWEQDREAAIPYSISIIVCLGLGLIFIIYLIMVTGRRPWDKELHLSRIDTMYSDVLLLAFLPIGVAWFFGLAVFMDLGRGAYGYMRTGMAGTIALIALGIVTAIVTLLCLGILLSITRKIKAGTFIKHSLIYQFVYSGYDFFKSLFDGRRFEKYPLTKALFYRQLVFIITSFLLVFFTFVLLITVFPLAVFPPILEVAVIYWYIKYNNKTFEEINAGFNESLEEQMKSERMKVALVTNVSHDLKTPLTSIISYIDLLSKEEDLSETAQDYVTILMEKSNRLKQIVSDLFDLAKSTSGDINVDFETLDFKKLMEQTLGDMEDEIGKSNRQIKTSLPEESITISSDGNKLYRVLQNVIDNALKYSLEGTRIYIDLEEKEGTAIATIKNIAEYEMDFTPEEVLQRFTRGDETRSTDGSGLGLSIAQSFTQVCGGDFDIEIDGDLFKVIITFPTI